MAKEKAIKENVKRIGSIQRVLELIKRFNDGQTICIDDLLDEVMWRDLSERTIRRDLGLIKEVYPNYFHHIDDVSGCYRAVTNDVFDNIVSPERMALIIQTFQVAERNKLYENLRIPDVDKRLIDKLIKQSEQHYLFKNKPFENHLANIKLFKQLEHAIYHRKELKILFPLSSSGEAEIVIRPYKILFMNENFYLASERTDNEQEFARYRISRIITIDETGKTFKRNFEIVDFIDAIQTPFAVYRPNFKQRLIEITLEADSSIKRYFKQKKYLPSQKETQLENGNLLIQYTVTDEREVESIVKRWIPLIQVVTPPTLKHKIQDDLTTYLQQNS